MTTQWFDGATYEADRDGKRLATMLARVGAVMADGC